MNQKLRWLGLAGLMALLAASAVACGGDDDDGNDPAPTKTLCDDVACEGGTTCDPADGACKCGGAGGPICHSDEVCVLEPTAACVSNACSLITCERGMSCDPTRGECTCGGAICDEGTFCIDDRCVTGGACAGVACGDGEHCDPADGLCKCGDQVCPFGQRCEDGACVEDRCNGVNCGEGSVCSPDDGLCHCGRADGPVCSTGQTCVGGAEAPACEGHDVCADAAIRCPTGTVCDPTSPTGACRCGGIGEAFPVCDADQTCNPERRQCLGGDQCRNVTCGDGLTCNPENGECTCGGVGRQPCAEGELCVAIGGEATCTSACNPFAVDPCGAGKGCFFDEDQREMGTFCAPLGVNPAGPDAECLHATDCQAGYHCAEVGDSLKCRAYCHETEKPCGNSSQRCNPIDPSGLGFCATIN